jgi:hypothetical protein
VRQLYGETEGRRHGDAETRRHGETVRETKTSGAVRYVMLVRQRGSDTAGLEGKVGGGKGGA